MDALFGAWFRLVFPLILLVSEGVDLLFWSAGALPGSGGLSGLISWTLAALVSATISFGFICLSIWVAPESWKQGGAGEAAILCFDVGLLLIMLFLGTPFLLYPYVDRLVDNAFQLDIGSIFGSVLLTAVDVGMVIGIYKIIGPIESLEA